MYGCENWTIKEAEWWRIDAFELWCWRRLLRVPWIERRSNQSILKEINPEYSLEGLMLSLKLQYSGHLMWRTDSLEKTLMLGRIKDRRRRGWQGMRGLEGITDSMGMNLSNSGRWWRTGKPRVLQSIKFPIKINLKEYGLFLSAPGTLSLSLIILISLDSLFTFVSIFIPLHLMNVRLLHVLCPGTKSRVLGSAICVTRISDPVSSYFMPWLPLNGNSHIHSASKRFNSAKNRQLILAYSCHKPAISANYMPSTISGRAATSYSTLYAM